VRFALVIALAALVLTGCGSHHHSASKQVTVGKYGAYGAETITAPTGAANGRLCKADADGFAIEAHSFVMRYGSTAASSTDVYYMGLREELADFDTRRCDDAVLGKALFSRLTAKQRRLLVAELTRSMAGRVRAALRAS
jgi:hypothetical protein